MRIFVDTADLAEIEEWDRHPLVSGFTTNPTLMRAAGIDSGTWVWSLAAATDKPISIDGPKSVLDCGSHVWRKRAVNGDYLVAAERTNVTAVCHAKQLALLDVVSPEAIISVFAGRIMDTGRDPQPVIDAARATGAQVLWASVRESYNIVQAEAAGCDIVTVPPAILRKYLDWHGKPLEVVAEETIAQFDRDREGLW